MIQSPDLRTHSTYQTKKCRISHLERPSLALIGNPVPVSINRFPRPRLIDPLSGASPFNPRLAMRWIFIRDRAAGPMFSIERVVLAATSPVSL